MGLKILLALADGRIHRLRFGASAISFREAPLTLTTLAALVPSELHAQVRIADASVQPVPLGETFDLVGISCITGTAFGAYAMADHFRRRGIPVVLGGVHVALCPEEAAQHADAIVIGFAEQTWPQLLRDFVAGKMQKIYRHDGSDLRGLPAPRRDLQKKFGYMMPNTVFATRGCKGTCEFCAVPAVPFGWHTRPVGEVVAEVRRIPARRFAFNDVNIIEDRDYARELFRALIPLKKTWGGLATTDIAQDPELLELMARSGCAYLLLGFESLAERALQGIGKAFNRPEDYPSVCRALHDRGIVIQGCFIFGMDSDTPDIFRDTVAAVNELQIDIPRYAVFTPYPATRAYQRLKAEDRLLHEYWPDYDTQHVVFRPKNMSPEELDAGFIRAWTETFTLKSIRHRVRWRRQFVVAFVGNLAYRLYVHRLHRDTNRFRVAGL
ncbi:MAG: hypothetical protein A3K19_13390 [Lentisphaerae bacterium RIFOXYB12_FULL_65_16]|nr:MAG: hypothetical protein A3K18_28910 [Lentisphaerae bacterium RIFOXYA12_64_32]OGV86287.1 MAG: hypothetical protein A3K19_13390 [Lentisphaerae bacterium RIFOXYB12_FULL_65_16]